MLALLFSVAQQSIVSTLVLTSLGLIIGAAAGGIIGFLVGAIVRLFTEGDALITRIAFAGVLVGAVIGAVWAFVSAP
jgi:hypothetical protein